MSLGSRISEKASPLIPVIFIVRVALRALCDFFGNICEVGKLAVFAQKEFLRRGDWFFLAAIIMLCDP